MHALWIGSSLFMAEQHFPLTGLTPSSCPFITLVQKLPNPLQRQKLNSFSIPIVLQVIQIALILKWMLFLLFYISKSRSASRRVNCIFFRCCIFCNLSKQIALSQEGDGNQPKSLRIFCVCVHVGSGVIKIGNLS